MWSTYNPQCRVMLPPSEERMQHATALLSQRGFNVVIGG